jgi:nucleoside-diphosphate-sugar epimerase
MRVLILGGSGFLGRTMFSYLKSFEDFELICGDILDPEIDRVEFRHIDMLDSKSSALIRNQFDIVINCTGQVTIPINTCYKLNSSGIDNIISSVRDTETKLVHISSVSIYGSCKVADEHTAFNPETPYSTCKAYSEYMLSAKLNPDQLTIVRLSNLYGHGQNQGILSYLIKSYKTDRELHFNNDGSLVRYYLNVEDCVTNLAKFFLNRNNFVSGVYNLLGNDRYTVIELIKLVEGVSKIEFRKHFDSIKPYDNTLIIHDEAIKSKLQLELSHSVEAYLYSRMRV